MSSPSSSSASNLKKYHYWITNKNDRILQLYWLEDKGQTIILSKCIYEETATTRLNKPFILRENLIIYESTVQVECNVVELNKNSRFIYNDDFTILEIEGKADIDLAETTFQTLSTDSKSESNVLFFVD